jgi:hypothetical protein
MLSCLVFVLFSCVSQNERCAGDHIRRGYFLILGTQKVCGGRRKKLYSSQNKMRNTSCPSNLKKDRKIIAARSFGNPLKELQVARMESKGGKHPYPWLPCTRGREVPIKLPRRIHNSPRRFSTPATHCRARRRLSAVKHAIRACRPAHALPKKPQPIPHCD